MEDINQCPLIPVTTNSQLSFYKSYSTFIVRTPVTWRTELYSELEADKKKKKNVLFRMRAFIRHFLFWMCNTRTPPTPTIINMTSGRKENSSRGSGRVASESHAPLSVKWTPWCLITQSLRMTDVLHQQCLLNPETSLILLIKPIVWLRVILMASLKASASLPPKYLRSYSEHVCLHILHWLARPNNSPQDPRITAAAFQ